MSAEFPNQKGGKKGRFVVEVRTHNAVIVAGVKDGRKTTKEIAFDHGISPTVARQVIAANGIAMMLVSAKEKKFLLEARSATSVWP